jgi:glycerol-3-phosphate dehydrogenase (NAD(P)+)
MQVAILGAGAWGTALAVALGADHPVSLWTRSAADRDEIRARRASRRLPEVSLPASVAVESDLQASVARAELIIVATSTEGLRPVARSVAGIAPRPSLLWACKGFEKASGLMAHRIVAGALPEARRVGVLSGPSFAIEVARGLPTALVVASADAGFAASCIDALSGRRLRVYSSADVIGVEIGGAVKNVIAIAAGICDGLALGRNARAALITRGLAEIVRFGVASGGRPETFMGLAGLGDLVLTCTADLSRNHRVGIGLAEGLPLDAILERLGHVAEGVHSAPSILAQARGMSIEMPITQSVCDVLAGSLSAPDAVQRLLARDPKPEH